MATRSHKSRKQAGGPKGLRWTAAYAQGRRRIVWATNRDQALALATVQWGKPASIEPAPADWRTAPRGGVKTRKIAIRVSEEELAALHRRYANGSGTFTGNLIARLLGD